MNMAFGPSVRMLAAAAGVSFCISGGAQALTIDQANFDLALGSLVVAESDAGDTLVLVSLNQLDDGEAFSFDDLSAQFISATTFDDVGGASANFVSALAGDPSSALGGNDGGVLVAPPGGPATTEFQSLGSATTGSMDIAQVQTPSVEVGVNSGFDMLFNALYLEFDIAFSDTLAEGFVLNVIGETLAAEAGDLIVVQRVAPVPLPAAAPMLIAAIAGLVFLRRRSKARSTSLAAA